MRDYELKYKAIQVIIGVLLCISLQAQTLKPGTYHNLKPTEWVVLDTGSYTFVGLQMNDLGKGNWLDARKASKLELVHCTFEGKGEGTAVLSAGDLSVSHCTFTKMQDGILQASPPGSVRKVTIVSNVFRDNGVAVRLEVEKTDNKLTTRDMGVDEAPAFLVGENTQQGRRSRRPTRANSASDIEIRGNTFTNNAFGVYLAGGTLQVNLRCNRFQLSCMDRYNGQEVDDIEHPCYEEANRVGLYVGENVALQNIGGPGGNLSPIVPAGNVWPVGNKSQEEIELSSYTLAGWAHLPNFTAVVNESEEPWIYYYFNNEFFNHLDNSSSWNALVFLKQRIAKTPDQEVPVGIDPNLVDVVCPNFGSSIVFPLLPRPGGNQNPMMAIKNELSEDQVLLGQNIPNPAQHTTTIPFYLPKSVKRARLEVFELGTGRVLKGFDVLQMGHGAIEFETRSLNAGMFGYRLFTDGQPAAHMKMVITH